MKKIKFIVEKGPDGYGAYREEPGNNLIATMGDSLPELKANIVEAYNLYDSKTKISEDQIVLSYDLPSFFKLNKFISPSGFADTLKMNKGLLSDYINGKRKPSDKQAKKILIAAKDMARNILEMDIE